MIVRGRYSRRVDHPSPPRPPPVVFANGAVLLRDPDLPQGFVAAPVRRLPNEIDPETGQEIEVIDLVDSDDDFDKENIPPSN